MATLIAGLKGRLRTSLLDSVAKRKRKSVARMIVLLRLAVTLKHVEALEEIPDLSVSVDQQSLTLSYPESWGTDHPLTIWEIEQGADSMEQLGVSVQLRAN